MTPRWLDHLPFGGASGVIALRRAARAVQNGDANVVACVAGDTNHVVLGFGSETIGTDAGQAAHFRPPYPCHSIMHGNGRLGLQCLANLDRLPPTGAVVIAAPLKILHGSGSPVRALAILQD